MDIKGPSNRQQIHATDVPRSPESAKSGRSADVRHVRSDNTHTSSGHPVGAQLEVLELVKKLGELPEVREERVREVAEKLSSGYYQTRAAAEQTAAILLQNDV